MIDLNKYKEFVSAVTSVHSNDTDALCQKLQDLENSTNVNMALMLTSSIGLSSEGGEFSEIVKNVYSKENHLIKILYSISNENLAIYCGIGSILAVHWGLTQIQ